MLIPKTVAIAQLNRLRTKLSALDVNNTLTIENFVEHEDSLEFVLTSSYCDDSFSVLVLYRNDSPIPEIFPTTLNNDFLADFDFDIILKKIKIEPLDALTLLYTSLLDQYYLYHRSFLPQNSNLLDDLLDLEPSLTLPHKLQLTVNDSEAILYVFVSVVLQDGFDELKIGLKFSYPDIRECYGGVCIKFIYSTRLKKHVKNLSAFAPDCEYHPEKVSLIEYINKVAKAVERNCQLFASLMLKRKEYFEKLIPQFSNSCLELDTHEYRWCFLLIEVDNQPYIVEIRLKDKFPTTNQGPYVTLRSPFQQDVDLTLPLVPHSPNWSLDEMITRLKPTLQNVPQLLESQKQ